MFDRLYAMFSRDIGIDLGTANTLVCVLGEGVVLNEPSVVAVQRGTNRVIDVRGVPAVGEVAQAMRGKCPANIEAIRPLKNGVIADFDIARAMIEYFVSKVHGRRRVFRRPRLVVSVPTGCTSVEKSAVKDAALRAGAREVYLIEEPKAACIGLGMAVMEPQASMVVDIGGGTTEVAVISLGDIVVAETVRVAGDDMDESIMEYLKRAYSMMIGERSAERIKIEIGSVAPLDEELTMEVKGRDMIAGLPRAVQIGSEEIREALLEPTGLIFGAVKRTLERTNPELAADLVDSGLTLAGGGALLRGLDRVIAKETGLLVHVADDPLTAVAIGTGVVLEELDLLKQILESTEDEG